jgi:hypothetical protein
MMDVMTAAREAIDPLDTAWVAAIAGWLVGLTGWTAVAIQRRELGRLRTENRTSWQDALVTYQRAHFVPFAAGR